MKTGNRVSGTPVVENYSSCLLLEYWSINGSPTHCATSVACELDGVFHI